MQGDFGLQIAMTIEEIDQVDPDECDEWFTTSREVLIDGLGEHEANHIDRMVENQGGFRGDNRVAVNSVGGVAGYMNARANQIDASDIQPGFQADKWRHMLGDEFFEPQPRSGD